MLELSRTEWSSVLELCNGVGLEQLWDSNGMKLKDDSDQLSALVGSCISSESDGQMINRVGSNLGDLKLVSDKGGHLYGPAMTKLIIKDPKPKPSTFMVSPSSSRRLVNTSDHHHHQKVSCLVDGCKADLNRCREYHRRHRVCELHSKTPVVIIRGQQKRFCQQCSRFHSLVEFDEVKRSCRKRLSGHNQRRRKPKPESLYFTSNNFLSNSKGPRILQFGSPQLCASTNVSNMWPAEAKSGQWLHAIDQRSAPKPFSGGDKQFFFLQRNEPKAAGSYQAAPQAFMCQPLPKTAALPAESRRGSYTTRASIDSGCALYLLSSHPTQNSVTVPNHLVQSNVTHPAGQLLDYSRLQMNCSDQFSSSHDVVDKPVNPEMMFLMGPDHGLLENGAQMLPIFLE